MHTDVGWREKGPLMKWTSRPAAINKLSASRALKSQSNLRYYIGGILLEVSSKNLITVSSI